MNLQVALQFKGSYNIRQNTCANVEKLVVADSCCMYLIVEEGF